MHILFKKFKKAICLVLFLFSGNIFWANFEQSSKSLLGQLKLLTKRDAYCCGLIANRFEAKAYKGDPFKTLSFSIDNCILKSIETWGLFWEEFYNLAREICFLPTRFDQLACDGSLISIGQDFSRMYSDFYSLVKKAMIIGEKMGSFLSAFGRHRVDLRFFKDADWLFLSQMDKNFEKLLTIADIWKRFSLQIKYNAPEVVDCGTSSILIFNFAFSSREIYQIVCNKIVDQYNYLMVFRDALDQL